MKMRFARSQTLAEVEDISPAKRVYEGVERRFEFSADGGKRGKLLLDPSADFVERRRGCRAPR